MLNMLELQQVPRRGVLKGILDCSTQWKGDLHSPKSDVVLNGDTLSIVDGNNTYILTEKFGLLPTVGVVITVVTVEKGFLLQLHTGTIVVNYRGKEHFVNEQGMIAPVQDYVPIEWYDLKRYYRTVDITVKRRYGLKKTNVESYIDNLLIRLSLVYKIDKLPLETSRYKDRSNTTATFDIQVQDMSETLGLGMFRFVNETEEEQARTENEKMKREQRNNEILRRREEELARKEMERKRAEALKNENKTKKSTSTTKSNQKDWASVLKGTR